MTEPILVRKVLTTTVTLWPNRVEITKLAGFGHKTESIPLKNITGAITGFGKQLEVVTADGKKHNLALGNKAAKEMAEAIMENI